MEIIAGITAPLPQIAAEAGQLESNGADVIGAAELGHDPLNQLLLAATGTQRARLMTGIAVAFARSPMTLALAAHDVNSLSGGRLMLGIGSQIKPHIEKRYSMPWSKPAARMREYVMALKAIWAAWYEGAPLDFRGEFYHHTLMTPMFTPLDGEHGAPPVLVAAVGPLMSENAAEVADGVLLHAFTTEEYVRTVTLPAIEAGLAKGGRDRSELKIVGAPFLVTGKTEEEFARVKLAALNQIAFYGSTPAYRGVLESVGYGELQGELNALSKQGRWPEMGQCVDDTLLEKIAVVGEPQQIGSKLVQRYGDVFDACQTTVYSGEGYSAGEFSQEIAAAIKHAAG
ncbi:TIGR03617 family F420-dependent LLM class oxidoreductase [Seongchinamella sediminis]|uniref:TIGR03617 family F420-dependent LLM class oxidoreductase n=1 Tax=Seongchinamella sediminis TaxID=2283635 RepID=A0A3L7E1Q6_9GAMM|nr:TIGR03617 family F420-dependent LLM class oxidoreductase [Seongchinamella sediminis]RLQ22620.1 TIGR03617 family F420-dependent LLM class oxidoreductase [Seongchinamella sediminis]